MTRAGWSFVELMVTIAIIGILTSIAIPALHDMKLKADAAHVIADFHAIRVAAHDNFAETEVYPSNGRWDRVPAEFVGSLPQGFEFSYRSATYRWRRWSLPNGLPRRRSTRALLGLQIRSSDRDLIKAITNVYNGDIWGNNRRITLVIE